MANNKEKYPTITIDTNIWCTQKELAHNRGVSPQYISNLIREEKIESWHIPELEIRLVKRD